MLKKESRITKKKEFDQIFLKGKSRYTDILGVKSLENGLTFNRFGLIVSNKVSKKAVIRNLLRRRLRSIVYKLELKNGFDCLVIVQKNMLDKSQTEIEKSLILCFKNLKLI